MLAALMEQRPQLMQSAAAGDADSFVTQLFPWPFAILRTNAVIGIAIE